MTMRDRIAGGKLFTDYCEGLPEDRMACKMTMSAFNLTAPDDIPKRMELLAQLLGKETRAWIEPPFYCCYGKNITIGEGSYINMNCNFIDDGKITIGKKVMFGAAVTIATVGHPINQTMREYMYTDPVTIGDNCWIGAGVVICPGVTIGENSVIGAGSVVVHDIPANVVAVGSLCRGAIPGVFNVRNCRNAAARELSLTGGILCYLKSDEWTGNRATRGEAGILKAFDGEVFAKAISGEVFEYAWKEIEFSGEKFVNTGKAHFGSAEVEEWELEQSEFRGCDQGETEAGLTSYIFTYFIKVSGVSYIEQEDDDRRETIIVPYGKHKCSGTVEVNVTRDAGQEGNEYLDAEMESVSLAEDSFEYEDSEYVVYCAECHKRIGYIWEPFDRNWEGNPICDDCMVTNSKGFVCGGCGRKLPEYMRGSSGSYCRDCESKLDI